jgi:hypothetical protein
MNRVIDARFHIDFQEHRQLSVGEIGTVASDAGDHRGHEDVQQRVACCQGDAEVAMFSDSWAGTGTIDIDSEMMRSSDEA